MPLGTPASGVPHGPHLFSIGPAPGRANTPFTYVPGSAARSRGFLSGHGRVTAEGCGKVLPGGGCRFPTGFSPGLSGHVPHRAAAGRVIARQRSHALPCAGSQQQKIWAPRGDMDQYCILGRIGEGAHGIVFKAKHVEVRPGRSRWPLRPWAAS